MTVEGQTVIVFGGSSGIGAATATLLAERGASVLAVGRDEGRLEALRKSVKGVKTARADLLRDADLEAVFKTVERVDHVVVTAATLPAGPIVGSSLAALRLPFEERVFALLRIVQLAVPKMKAGSFVFTSGTLPHRPAPGMGLVGAAISAVEHLARVLALELAPIRANVIAPGVIATDLLRNVVGDQWEATLAHLSEQLPGKRAGTPRETAEAIHLLLTNEFINGEVLSIDGAGRFV